MKPLPLNDLRPHCALLRQEINEAVNRVLDSGWYVNGEELRGFEEEFAAFVGRRHCVGVANGTDAIELALRAMDIGAGDEVITVANAGMYTTTACMQVGAKPVYVDIDPETMTIAPEAVRDAITPAVRVVVVTHLYGQVADIDAIRRAIGSADVRIVEDCAQAHGARLGWRRAGSLGDIATFSFYPTKNLGACGDAGAVVLDDSGLAAKLMQMRQYGWKEKYHSECANGRNSRLDEIQAAILRVKLPRVDAWNSARRQIYAAYFQASVGTGLRFSHTADERFVAHLCVARSSRRQATRELFRSAGIATEIHYPVLDFDQRATQSMPHRIASKQHSEEAVREILSLPCHPAMSSDDVDRICGVIHSIPAK